jgi:anti-sigma factor RsiW
MNCVESKPLVGSYVDGELDLAHSLDIERHIEGCVTCAMAYRNALTLQSLVREKVPYFRASEALRQRVGAITAAEPAARAAAVDERAVVPPGRRFSWNWAGNWSGMAAAFALALVVVLIAAPHMANLWGPSQENLLAGEIESAHVRSLMANHLMDVPSTDQHTVKPWFHGKLDFAPPVGDFATEGFPLVGGRLDYIHGQAVASLVYQRRQHPINVFVWPAAPADKDTAVKELARDGYNILHWTSGGMNYWAISDLGVDEMRQFASLLRR